MANTYHCIHYHIVFGVYDRLSLIQPHVAPRLYSYIGSVLKSRQMQPLKIGGVGDHIHILAGATPTTPLADAVRDIKTASTKWINENRLCIGRFQWQRGYGVFSVSQSNLERVASYIANQPLHHAQVSFAQEFKSMLDQAHVNYQEEYLPKDID